MPLLYVVGGARVAGLAGLPGPGPAQAGALLMTANGIFQLALYVVVLLALAKPLGAYMARVYEGQPFGLDRVLGWLERLIYRAGGVRPDAGDGLEDLRAGDARRSTCAGLLAVYLLQRLQGVPAAQPAGLGRRLARLVVQHRGQLRHQHQLAGLRRRDDDELPHADARPDRAELRLGGDRHGGAGRADPRLRAPLGADDRQLLGRPDARARSTSCCRCRSSWRWSWCRRAWCRRSAVRKVAVVSRPSTTSR